MKTDKQLEAELMQYAQSAGKNHFERLRIADQLLRSEDWIQSNGQGNLDRALSYLERRYFADLLGSMTLVALLECYQNVPFKEWERQHFDFQKIWGEWKASTRPAPQPRQRNSTQGVRGAAPIQVFNQLSPPQQSREYERSLSALEKSQRRVEELEQENAALKRENAALKGQLKAFRELANQKIA